MSYSDARLDASKRMPSVASSGDLSLEVHSGYCFDKLTCTLSRSRMFSGVWQGALSTQSVCFLQPDRCILHLPATASFLEAEDAIVGRSYRSSKGRLNNHVFRAAEQRGQCVQKLRALQTGYTQVASNIAVKTITTHKIIMINIIRSSRC